MDQTNIASNMSEEHEDELTIHAEDGELVYKVNGVARLKVPREAARTVAIRTLRCANDLRYENRWPND